MQFYEILHGKLLLQSKDGAPEKIQRGGCEHKITAMVVHE
jgi:hypothetical protein